MQAQRFDSPLPQFVVANGARHENVRVSFGKSGHAAGEIQWSTAQASTIWKNIPERFTEASNNACVSHPLNSSSGSMPEQAQGSSGSHESLVLPLLAILSIVCSRAKSVTSSHSCILPPGLLSYARQVQL
jgi:hypothetical protein